MPDNSREQMPIKLLVSHLLERDGSFVVLIHLPYVIMAVLIYLYMMNSVKHLSQGPILGLPMRELIQMCAMFILLQKIIELPTLIMFALPLNTMKQMSIVIDLLLIISTMIFMNNQGTDPHLERIKVFEEKIYLQWCMNLMVGCTFWNLLEVLRLFKSTRTMSQYFIYVIWELRPFMLILFVMVFGFGMLEFLNMPEPPEEGEKYEMFKDILMD